MTLIRSHSYQLTGLIYFFITGFKFHFLAEGFAHTGIVLNARILGGLEVIEEKDRKLWKPGMKLIVVTYCITPEEQEQAYQIVHEICQ
jgi:hypothetical protein